MHFSYLLLTKNCLLFHSLYIFQKISPNFLNSKLINNPLASCFLINLEISHTKDFDKYNSSFICLCKLGVLLSVFFSKVQTKPQHYLIHNLNISINYSVLLHQ